MKRPTAALLCLLFLLGALSGCGAADGEKGSAGEKKIQVVAAIFPAYDWTRRIVGDAGNVELTLLLDNGADLHSYQPTADDMVKIASCDLLIYVGGESDEWIADALKTAVNKNMRTVNLLETLGDAAKEEELVEGMQGEEEDGGEGPAYDEHVWLSLRNARTLCTAIADAMGTLDAAHADTYASNAAAYCKELDALDRRYADAVSAARVKTVLFGDRFPFRYLTDDYGLAYYAAFVGCSAETEASFETIVFLANKVDELGLKTVLTIESGDGKIARAIIENTAAKNADVLRMDSLQSVTAAQIADGTDYLGVMAGNLEILKQALQ